MRLHILVEGKSEQALLDGWLPRFLPGHSFQVIVHRGKGRLSDAPGRAPRGRQGLLDQLPHKLRAYGRSLDPRTDRVLVLVDADDDDCADLERRLHALAGATEPCPEAEFRLAVEETEAFYLGDRAAIRAAYPSARLTRLRGYVQDSICGTWERFMEVIGASSEDKVAWAQAMGRHLSARPGDNASPSFRSLCDALLRLSGEAEPLAPAPRHTPRRRAPARATKRQAARRRR